MDIDEKLTGGSILQNFFSNRVYEGRYAVQHKILHKTPANYLQHSRADQRDSENNPEQSGIH